jgi:hypothetical protein
LKKAEMKRLHKVVGLSVIVAFLLTGQFLDHHNPRMTELDDGTRMMFRSRHIYILLAGLLNLGIGIYFSYGPTRRRKVIQVIGSCLIVVAPFLLIGAFFYEPTLEGLQGTLTLPAMIALLTGTLLHFVSGVRQG